MKEVKRQSNFELMRIVSMLFIILWHILIHGHVIDNCQNAALKTILQITQYVIIVHVNSFVVLMGFFQSKSIFKVKKVLKLIIQVIFYSVTIFLISLKVGWINDINSVDIINSFLPSVSLYDYWFIGSYIIVYCFSDIINKFISLLDKKDYKKVLIISFLFLSLIPFLTGQGIFNNSGYNFYSFIFLYMIGGYLRRYPINTSYHFKLLDNKKYMLIIILCFILCIYINYTLTLFGASINNQSNVMSFIANRINSSNLCYSTPMVIIQTICYFELFRCLKLKNKYINNISANVIGVYLIHDNHFIRENIYNLMGFDTKIYSYKFIIIIISAVLSIFIVCIIFDKIRQVFFYYIDKIIFKNKKRDKQ